MTDDTPITVQVDNGIATVTLNRGKTLNAFTAEMNAAFADTFPRLRDDATLQAVILTATPGTFSAGGDKAQLATADPDPRAHALAGRRMHDWFQAYLDIPVPVIAAVDGPAFGGGFALVLGADIALASPGARFCTVFPRIGLVAGLGTSWLLPRVVGLARARDLLLTGRIFDAAEAERLGLVLSLHDPDDLRPRAIEMAGHFRHASRDALAGTKRLLRDAQGMTYERAVDHEIDLQARAMSGAAHHAAARSLLETRKVAFDWNRLDAECGTRKEA